MRRREYDELILGYTAKMPEHLTNILLSRQNGTLINGSSARPFGPRGGTGRMRSALIRWSSALRASEPPDRAACSPNNRREDAPLSGCAALIRPVRSLT